MSTEEPSPPAPKQMPFPPFSQRVHQPCVFEGTPERRQSASLRQVSELMSSKSLSSLCPHCCTPVLTTSWFAVLALSFYSLSTPPPLMKICHYCRSVTAGTLPPAQDWSLPHFLHSVLSSLLPRPAVFLHLMQSMASFFIV